jgi:hypothetical protein
MPRTPLGRNAPQECGCAAGRDGPDKAREGRWMMPAHCGRPVRRGARAGDRRRTMVLFAALLLAGAAVTAPLPRSAHAADFKINPPSIDQGEISLEDNSAVIVSRGGSTDSTHSHFAELGYGITDFWWTEIEGHWESGEDGFKFRTVDFENAFRLIRQESWWPETALFVEYDQAAETHSTNTATLGTLFRKDFGPSSTTFNVLFDHDLGRNATTGVHMRYTGISTWQFDEEFAPGIEVFGDAGRVGSFVNSRGQDHRLGPAISGSVDIEGVGEFGYAFAYLFGLTPTSPNGTVVWHLEFDRRF